MSKPIAIFRTWLPFAVVVTAFCALAYVVVQQSLRMGANDPQIQMAEDAAAALDKGAGVDAVVPKQAVEFSSSPAPFLDIYDASGKPVGGNGLLNGQLPVYPVGALQAARQTGENRVSWQPQANVRIASVAVPYKDGYVLAGRSLREVEQREAQTELLAAVTWLVTIVAVLIVIAIEEYVLPVH